MPYHILKGLVYTMGSVSVLTLVVAKVIEYGDATLFGVPIEVLAWWVSAWPLIACGLFILLQGMPGGRKIVGAPWLKTADVWPLILVLLMATTSPATGRLVGAASTVGSTGFLRVTLGTVLICIVARIIQLNVGARLGVTLDEGTSPMLH